MSGWMTLLFVVLAVAVAWFAFHTMKNNPAAFSKENMGKSFFTIGLLTLVLIAFIALLVFLLKH